MPTPMIDTLGYTHDVPDEYITERASQGWKPQTHPEVLQAANEAVNEREYGGVGGGIKAGLAGAARGLSLGGSDLLARAVGGEDTAIALEGYREAHPYVSTGSEIVGAAAPALLSAGASTPASAAGAAGRSVAALAGGGIRGAIAGGAVEGGLFGAGQAVSNLSLSQDPVTLERVASELSSNVLFGAAAGGVVGGGVSAVERGLTRAGRILEEKLAEHAVIAGVPGDLVGLDAKGLRAARDVEIDRLASDHAAARAVERSTVVDETLAYRDAIKEANPWLVISEGEDAARLSRANKAMRNALDDAKGLRENPGSLAKPLRVEEKALEGAIANKAETAAKLDEINAKIAEELEKHVAAAMTKAPSIPVKATPLSEEEFQGMAAQFHQSIPENVSESLKAYSGQGIYAQTNAPMREGFGKPGMGGARSVSKDLRETLDQINDGINRSPAPRPVEVYRGVSGKRSTAQMNELKIGDSFIDPAPVSTSYLQDIGQEYSKGFGVRKGVEMRIAVPEGYGAAPIPSRFPKEREILLAGGGKFTVTGIEEAADGHRILHLALTKPEVVAVTDDIPAGFSLIGKDSAGRAIFDESPDIVHGVPKYGDIPNVAVGKNIAYVVRPSELADVAVFGKPAVAGKFSESSEFAAIEIDMIGGVAEQDAAGKWVKPTRGYVVVDGNETLMAAAAAGDRPVLVRFLPSAKRIEGATKGVSEIADDLKKVISAAPKSPAMKIPAPSAPDVPAAPPPSAPIELTGKAARRYASFADVKLAKGGGVTLDHAQAAAFLDALKSGAVASDSRTALDALDGLLERNRALQNRLKSAASPLTPRSELVSERLAAIDNAKDALTTRREAGLLEKAASGAVFGAATGLAASIPLIGQIPGVAHLIGAKTAETVTGLVFGRSAQAAKAVLEKTKTAVDALTRVAGKAADVAPVIATKTLQSVRYASSRDDEDVKALPELYRQRTEEIKRLTEYDETGTPRMRFAARQQMAQLFKPIAAVDPVAADRLETIATRRIEHVSSVIPRRPDFGTPQIGPDNWQPSDMQMMSFARTVAATEDPSGVEHRAAAGALTPEDAAAYWAVYPERAQHFKMTALGALQNNNTAIPFDRKLALSMLFGQPMDPSLHPRVIAVLQGQFPAEPGTSGGAQPPRAAPQFGSMSKVSEHARTPAQERAAR